MRCHGIGLFNEYNVVKPISRPKARIAILYPSTYQASITNLFTHMAYFYLYDNLHNVLVDRFTLNNMREGALSREPLAKFDYVLASIGFEFDLMGLVKILMANGLNPLKNHRKGVRPVIIAGGPPITANPLIASGIADVSFVGEAEGLLKALVDAVHRGSPSVSTLLESLECAGVRRSAYTGLEDEVVKYTSTDLNDSYAPPALIRSCKYKPVYGDGYYVEASRGCKWLCPFCMEAYVSYPPRFRRCNVIKSLILEGLKYIKEKRVVFYSLSFFDHPESDEILKWLINNDCSYSIPSIRYHTLCKDRVDLIKAGGQRTLTLAPETGVEEAADLIGKELNISLLQDLTQHALDSGLNVKLYFMFGIPGESIDAGVRAGEVIRKLLAGHNAKGRVRVAVNPLVPKSMTPCQYVPLISKDLFNRKLRDLINRVKGLGVQVESYEWEWAWIQSILSLGGEWVSKLVVKWVSAGGSIAAFKSVVSDFVSDPEFTLKPREVSTPTASDIVKHELSNLVRLKAVKLLEAVKL